MPKMGTTEKLQAIQVPELKALSGTSGSENGRSIFRVVGKNDTSDFTHHSSQPKLPEGKQRRSSTGDLLAPEFAWERFHAIAHELPPLFIEHWRELALNRDAIPLDPDWDKFYALDVQGILRVLTVRLDKVLIGYAFLLVGPHLHYRSTIWGHVDMYWIDPVARTGWTGIRMFKHLIRDAKVMGAVNLTLSTKHHFMDNRVTKLLQRLGFTPIETVHSMRL